MILTFDIRPQSKQSVRGGKKNFYTDPKKKQYVKDLREMAKKQLPEGFKPFTGPVRIIKLVWQFKYTVKQIGKSNRKKNPEPLPHWRDTVPDKDNLKKPLADALNGLVYVDDCQIVLTERVAKIWGPTNKITLEIEEF
jgi:Holliday junction resolvase RusA-like endonuclease